MATGRPVRRSLTPATTWRPGFRADRARPTSSRATSTSTLRTSPAPVRPGRRHPTCAVAAIAAAPSGDNIPNRQFVFARSVGGACELRRSCLRAKSKWGRRVRLHPQEGWLQRARMLPRSAQYPEIARRRRVIEHRLARLVQLGVRRTRFFGRTKTAYQLLMAATVANLTLTAGKVGALGPGGPDTGPSSGKCPRSGGDNSLNRATSAATAALLADIDAIAANNASELLSAPIRRIRTLLVQLADTGRLAWGFRPSL